MIRFQWGNCVPQNFKKVISFLITSGAFWRYTDNGLDFTVGHFATKIGTTFYTSHRNDYDHEILSKGLREAGKADFVPDYQSIVHFHCPAITDDFTHNIPSFQCEYSFNHGPHLSFNDDASAYLIIEFIKNKFNLKVRTTAL